MANSEHPIEWFLGRDGKQHGPITALEMRKLVEMNHLRPNDLVWRQGMANWVPAQSIRDELAPPIKSPPPPAPPPAPPAPLTARTAGQGPEGPPETARGPADPPAPTAPTTDPRGPRGGPQSGNPPGPAHPVAYPGRDGAPFGGPAAGGPAPMQGQPQAAPPGGAPPPRHQNPTGPSTPGAGPQGYAPHGPGPQRAAPYPGAPMGRGGPAPGQSARAPAPHPGSYPPPPVGAGEPLRVPPPHPPPPHGHARRPAHDDTPSPSVPGRDEDALPRRRFSVRAAVLILLLCVAGGFAAAVYHSGQLSSLSLPFLSPASKGPPVVRAPQGAAKEAPLTVTANTPEAVDAGFQKAALWQLLKREFPDWYKERVAETAKLRAENRDDKAIAAYLTQKLVELRRKNAGAALAANPARLKFVAATFVENLASLQKHSIDACYGFISQGESNPMVVELMRSGDHSARLQAQFAAIFEAIVDGRKSPRAHPQPRREDYDVLAQQLAQKGWSPIDLQLFSDANALARAPAGKVCQMVQDWFSAQLAVKDEATLIRLLVEALKPFIAG